MKTLLLTLSFLLAPFLFATANTITAESVCSDTLFLTKQDLHKLTEKIQLLENSLKTIQAKQKKDSYQISLLKSKLAKEIAEKDSLEHDIILLSNTVSDNKTHAQTKFADVTKSIVANDKIINDKLNSKTLMVWCIVCVLLLLIIILYCWQKKKYSSANSEVVRVKDELKTLHAEYDKYDKSIMDTSEKLLSVIEKQLSTVDVHSKNDSLEDKDHSLAIAVANEIARIQQNLNHMDQSVKGVSQLKNRVKAIVTTLKSKQYDIPDLLGKEYHEGDNLSVTMELNEELEIGKSIIKRVIKPQVSYAGKLIQEAEVVVEYNE